MKKIHKCHGWGLGWGGSDTIHSLIENNTNSDSWGLNCYGCGLGWGGHLLQPFRKVTSDLLHPARPLYPHVQCCRRPCETSDERLLENKLVLVFINEKNLRKLVKRSLGP